MPAGEAARRIRGDAPDIGKQKSQEQQEHNKKNQNAEPDVLHRVDADDLRGQKHGERIRDRAGETESAGEDAADEACEGIVAEQYAERGDDRQHRQHFLEQPKEGAEAVEQERHQNKQQGLSAAEAFRDRTDQGAYAADVVHDLESG